MSDIEMCNEASVHDQLSLQVVHNTEANAEPHANVNPVYQPCVTNLVFS